MRGAVVSVENKTLRGGELITPPNETLGPDRSAHPELGDDPAEDDARRLLTLAFQSLIVGAGRDS